MPTASLHIAIDLPQPPATVFAYVSDLTKHGEWAANPLRVEATSLDPVGVGKEYRSTASVNALTFTAALRLIAYQPPSLFAFSGHDSTGAFTHEFRLQPRGDGGTHLERHITFELGWRQWLMFGLLYFPVRRPAARRALELLAQRLAQMR